MISSSADILFVFDEEDDENTLKPTYLEDVIVDEIKKLDINSNTMRTEVLVPISSYLKCFFISDFKQIYMTSSKTGSRSVFFVSLIFETPVVYQHTQDSMHRHGLVLCNL